MKVLISILTMLVASCNAGFLFAASGFYGGVEKDLKSFIVDDVAEKVIIPKPVLGVSKVIKTFPKVYADFDEISGRTVVVPKPYFGVSKVIKTFPKVYADYSDISGRTISPGEVLVSKSVFGVPKLIKTIPKVYADPYVYNGRRAFGDLYAKDTEVTPEVKESDTESDHGEYVGHENDGNDVQQEGETIKLILIEDENSPLEGGGQAHQNIKTIKVIRVAAGHGGNVGNRGHSGEGGNQEIKTIQVINEEGRSVDHGGIGTQAGPSTRDHNSQYGTFGGHREVQTIKVIQDYNPYVGTYYNGPSVGFANGGFAGSNGSQKIKIIKVNYAGDGSPGPIVYGGQKGYGNFDNKYYQKNLIKLIH
ncbi:PREDICTED: uncharacterized protein LOC108381486 [Rhagoletis zephyria]|uniref:uncharacterized protein LOC108381486 n=1 Tax=Rhagoletis zephyria TaxID=28612 RepID=UPI000811430A|nr:PREDICTED: uncharacterized protein LOC108381486 [Rhagoletis zephyria]